MFLTITLTLALLVTVNFLLLKFSCNKTEKKRKTRQPVVLKLDNNSEKLAPTGS